MCQVPSSFKLSAGCSWLSRKPVFYWVPCAVLGSGLYAASPSFSEPELLGAQHADGTCCNAVTASRLWFTPLAISNVQICGGDYTKGSLLWTFIHRKEWTQHQARQKLDNSVQYTLKHMMSGTLHAFSPKSVEKSSWQDEMISSVVTSGCCFMLLFHYTCSWETTLNTVSWEKKYFFPPF